jgi:high-affinity nickel-transport protein
VLFAAGMSIFDTADGVFMARAYDWAFLRPIRKIFYNLTVTVLSVVVALVVGVLVLIGLMAEKLEIESGPLGRLGNLDLDYVGYTVIGLFVLTWLLALVIWKFGRFEERYANRQTGEAGAPCDGGLENRHEW